MLVVNVFRGRQFKRLVLCTCAEKHDSQVEDIHFLCIHLLLFLVNFRGLIRRGPTFYIPDSVGTRKTEVTYFDIVVGVEQYVFKFEV